MAALIVGEERYVFETQWYDQQAELNRYYRITFFPGDSTIEMVSPYFNRSFFPFFLPIN
jgi:hypothetical protein